jgi:hypothetical protein
MIDLVNNVMSSFADGHQGVQTFLQAELKFYGKPEKSTIISIQGLSERTCHNIISLRVCIIS